LQGLEHVLCAEKKKNIGAILQLGCLIFFFLFDALICFFSIKQKVLDHAATYPEYAWFATPIQSV